MLPRCGLCHLTLHLASQRYHHQLSAQYYSTVLQYYKHGGLQAPRKASPTCACISIPYEPRCTRISYKSQPVALPPASSPVTQPMCCFYHHARHSASAVPLHAPTNYSVALVPSRCCQLNVVLILAETARQYMVLLVSLSCLCVATSKQSCSSSKEARKETACAQLTFIKNKIPAQACKRSYSCSILYLRFLAQYYLPHTTPAGACWQDIHLQSIYVCQLVLCTCLPSKTPYLLHQCQFSILPM